MAQLTVFVLRRDELADEIRISSLSHTSGEQTAGTGEVRATGGVASPYRPAGAA